MADGKRYRSIKIISAEPIIEHDFIMSTPQVLGAGAPRNGYRQGYRIEDAKGRVSWMPKQEFEEEYREIEGELQ